MTQVDQQYKKVIKDILDNGYEQYHETVGCKVKALPGVTFEFDKGFPVLSLRNIAYKVFIPEIIWCLTGSRRVDEFLDQYTKIWHGFANIDKVVTVAYGYRWRRHFGRDQIGELIQFIQKDRYTRQGVVIAWDPGADSLMSGVEKRNVPCPFAFTVNVMDEKLNMHNIIRSNDMYLGFPHDTAGFAFLQRILAKKLGLGVGKFTISISHAHLYENQYEAARELIAKTPVQKPFDIELPDDVFERAEQGDHDLVSEIFKQFEEKYTPLAGAKKVKITPHKKFVTK